MTGQTDSLNSSAASLPTEDSSWELLDVKVDQEEKERHHSGDSGVEDQSCQESSAATTLEFKLTKSLLSQVRAEEDNKGANSGEQMYRDLQRMRFVINDEVIDEKFVIQLRDKHSQDIQNNKRQIANLFFTEMFEYVGAQVSNNSLIEELITNCNQAGFQAAVHMQIHLYLLNINYYQEVLVELTITHKYTWTYE